MSWQSSSLGVGSSLKANSRMVAQESKKKAGDNLARNIFDQTGQKTAAINDEI